MRTAIPKTPFALLSGSAQWGLAFPDDLKEPGIKVVARGLTFETPWGPTENWQLIEASGATLRQGSPRLILNVFSHGWPVDAIDHSAHRKVAWVLNQAGVRKSWLTAPSGPSVNFCNRAISSSRATYSIFPRRNSHFWRGD